MSEKKVLWIVILICLANLNLISADVIALPSPKFEPTNGEVVDGWDVVRTRAHGSDGFLQISRDSFRPIIVAESLAERVDIAFAIGEEFAKRYPDTNRRAEKIFRFVKDHVRYTPDTTQFGHREFARNADEMAQAIKERGVTGGDCEDYAVFLAVIFQGAGLPSAIVLAPEHAAALVYLPSYRRGKALGLEGETGWFWAEATGRNNPLGWVPKRLVGKRLLAYEVSAEPIWGEGSEPKLLAISQESRSLGVQLSPLMSIIALMGLVPIFGRMLMQLR